jgi:starch synthase
LLGSGDPTFERGFKELQQRYPDKVAVKIGYDHGLSHRIEAGCDFFLMPSRFEPCGLNQMYSLRYATIPIVRVTGGLDDSVTDITEHRRTPTASSFLNIPRALWQKPSARRSLSTKTKSCSTITAETQ